MSEINLSPVEHIILAIDTSSESEAERLVAFAKKSGTIIVKFGLELESATSWLFCSDLASDYEIEWVADAKLKDSSDTVQKAVKNIMKKPHPPFGITVYVDSGFEAMQKAQSEASDNIIFGVTEPTTIPPNETAVRHSSERGYYVQKLAVDAADGNLKGIVASAKEVKWIKNHEFTSKLISMIPGTRSIGASTHNQKNVLTSGEAIKNGADFLVIGREVTQAEDPEYAIQNVVRQIEEAA